MPMRRSMGILAAATAASSLMAGAALAEEITVATVNNGDMIIMQKLSPEWEKATGNKVNWVVLEEKVLRERVTTDIATKGGQFDVMTIGGYETPIWGKAGWLTPLNDLGADYDYDDLIAPVRSGLTVDGNLYAVPFYAESSFTLYRLETNVRSATTLGIVGAGGIGQTLYESIRSFQYGDTAAQIIIVVLTVMLLDVISARIRKALV